MKPIIKLIAGTATCLLLVLNPGFVSSQKALAQATKKPICACMKNCAHDTTPRCIACKARCK